MIIIEPRRYNIAEIKEGEGIFIHFIAVI